MHELYDVIAGSETGGIIATFLSIPNYENGTNTINTTQANKYWASNATDFFMEEVDNLWRDCQYPPFERFMILIQVILISGVFFYRCIEMCYTNNEFTLEKIETLLEDQR